MKKLLFGLSLIVGINVSAQSICFVSADFNTAENYIVFWEKPADELLYDSVYIYRRIPASETVFTRVGGTSMQSDGSFFQDLTSLTHVVTDYAITFVDYDGYETSFSPYHRPVILDYQNGNLVWTMYEKEFVTGDAWVSSYRCMRDNLGLGFYDEMGLWEASGTSGSWFDSEAAGNTDFVYQMEMDMPICVVEGRANINTSRSNIKNQFSNAEMGIEETEEITISIAPNPVIDALNITVDAKFLNQDFVISDAVGRIIEKGTIGSSTMSIDMAKQMKNTYLFTIKYEGKMYSKFFVKH